MITDENRRISWDDLLRPGDASRFFARDPLPVFDPGATTFSAANAWWLAELSRIVYRLGPTETATPLQPLRSELLASAGFEELQFFRSDATGTGALLVRARLNEPFAVLVFRGTEQELQDYIHDADTLLVPAFDQSTRVHRGFKRALNSVWSQIEFALRTIDCPLFFAGHSLGAALATLAAVRRQPRAVYAFGSPRVGDAALKARLGNVAIYRVVHGADVVTTCPPELLGFAHVGEEHRIGNTLPFELRLNPAFLWNRLTTPVDMLADHAPINYVNFI
ncbi:MAG: lipase family protein [Povalibacter sp.]